ncbi:MAG: acyl-CoA dehydrogenase family protein [Xanthomonadales bacterium]|nr:acyl-CoA dehydrogenase family protein [Xanthomonadales bacterium]
MNQQTDWSIIRQQVKEFVEQRIYPAEPELESSDRTGRNLIMAELIEAAKASGLWALGHPKELGGQGMPFLDYVHVNEVIGRSFYAMQALGTLSLQDSLMLNRYASPAWKGQYLEPLVAGTTIPSFAMTEPDVSSSDPTQLQTTAVLEGDHWVLNGRKWFITGAGDADYTTVMCRTETDAPKHECFSLIIIPTNNPGYRIIRDTPVLGLHGGHWEIEFNNARVPQENLLGERGKGFRIAQERLGPGRIFHCMRWLGQAQRAFDLMCHRLNEREAFGEPLANKQLMQSHVFESAAEIQACRQLTLNAARKLDEGSEAREEIGLIKVVGARMLHNVVDRAIQVYGAKGLTDDTPLSRMYRHAREARIYDGPDEVHIQSVARRYLKQYRAGGPGIDFGE